MQALVPAVVAVSAILASSVAIGAFLDKYTSPKTRSKIWNNIKQADEEKLTAAAINTVVIAYESIFGRDISTYAFFKRSMLAYAVIIVISIALLWVTFRVAFIWAISPFLMGSFFDGAVAATLISLGGLFFWGANAQTLYFLRVAQRDPRPTPVLLIFYADTLLTASICVVGVGTLLWLHSLSYLTSGGRDVTLEVRVQPVSSAFRDEISATLSYRDLSRRIASVIEANRRILDQSAVLSVRNVPSPAAEALFRRDFDMVMDLFPRAGIAVRRYGNDTAQFVNSRGAIFSYADRAAALGTGWDRDFKGSAAPRRVCGQLLNIVRSRRLGYVVLERIEVIGNWNLQTCVRGAPGRIRARVAINVRNVDYQRLLTMQFAFVFQNLVPSTLAGLRSGTSMNPLHYLSNQPGEGFSDAWRHRQYISDFDRSGVFDLDQKFLEAYLSDDGIRNILLSKSLPAGAMISAIMATSLFTIVLLVSAIFAGLVGRSARVLRTLDRSMLVHDHPFVFVFLFVGICVSIAELIAIFS